MIGLCTLTLSSALAYGSVSLVDRGTSSTSRKPSAIYEDAPSEINHRYSANSTRYYEIPTTITPLYGITAVDYLKPQQSRTIEAESLSLASRAIATQLVSVLVAEPVEAGYDHPAEDVIQNLNATSTLDLKIALDHLINANDTSDALKSSLLIMIGRASPISDEWRAQIISKALASTSVCIRDAALQAAEELMDSSLLSVLTAHEEPIKWLNSYQKTIISSLQTRNSHA